MRTLLQRHAVRALAAPGARALSTRSAGGALAPLPPSASAAPPLTPEMISPLLDRMDGLTTIVGYDRWGFNVSNVHMRGSVLVLPTFTLLWDVRAAVDICPRSVAPLFMFTPKPEFVLVGAGLGEERHVNPALYAFLARKGISLEVMSIVRGGARRGAASPWRRPNGLAAPLILAAPFLFFSHPPPAPLPHARFLLLL